MACTSPPAATILFNFSFSCKVDAAITSIFLVVNRFYMQILLQMTHKCVTLSVFSEVSLLVIFYAETAVQVCF